MALSLTKGADGQDYAVAEVARCAANPVIRGIKLHLGNARVDFHNTEHVEKVRREKKMAIVAHLWNGPDYGRAEAEIFLNQILPAAPDVPVQLAHFGGGGPGWSDDALAVFADAIQANDARMKNVYFDMATVADQQTPEELRQLADLPDPRRANVPLTEEEMKVIEGNVAPYFAK